MKALILVSLILVACGQVPEETGSMKLTDETPEFTPREKTPVEGDGEPELETAVPETTVNSAAESGVDGDSSSAVIPQSVQVQSIPSEPRTPEQEIMDGLGIDYFMDGRRIYAREQDYEVAQNAINSFASPLGWDLLLRPNDEILTSKGFQAPPIPVAAILANRGITDYEIEGDVIYIDASQLPEREIALQILSVFYPDTPWDIQVRPEPEPEEPTEPESPESPENGEGE